MNIVVWVVTALIAAAFLAVGFGKLTQHKKVLAERMGWVEDFSPGAIKAIGAAELLGAIGVVLPAAVRVAPVLSPIAATGLGVTMIGAMVVHARRREWSNLGVNVMLLVLAAFVAWARFGPYAR